MKLIIVESRMSVIHILGVRMLLLSLPLIRTVEILMFNEINNFLPRIGLHRTNRQIYISSLTLRIEEGFDEGHLGSDTATSETQNQR